MLADPYVAAHVPDQSQAKEHDGPRTGTYAIRTVYNVGNMTIHWKKSAALLSTLHSQREGLKPYTKPENKVFGQIHYC